MPGMEYKFEERQAQVPQRTDEFLQTVSRIDPKVLANLHKNVQEAIGQRYKGTVECFRAMQEQQSGSVTMAEFGRWLERMGFAQGCHPKYIEALFACMDDEDRGKIGYQQFCRWLKPNDKHENLMVCREDPYVGIRGGLSYLHRTEWIKMRIGRLCE